jgi:hypothetical protein
MVVKEPDVCGEKYRKLSSVPILTSRGVLNISAICGLICRLLKVFEKTNYLEKSDSKNEIYHPTFNCVEM